MAGPITALRTRPALGQVIDWLVLLGVLGLIAGMAFGGVTFLPAAGFAQNRPPLLAFDQAALLIGAGAFGRWLLLGGRALPRALLWGVSAVAALGLLSLVTTTDLSATREAVLFLVAVVVTALAVAICATDGGTARAMLAALALLGVGEALIGLGQYASGAPTPAYWLSRAFAGVIRTRVHGTLGNPNVLANFLLVGIGATVLLAVDLGGRRRVLPMVALAVEIAALALTYSRGGYLGLAAFVLAAALLLWPVRRRAWPVLLVVAVMAGLAALALPAVGLRGESIGLDPGDTAQSRFFIWRTAGRMWQAHRVWGTGIGTFNAAYPSYRPLGVRTTYAMLRIPGSAHNDYLQVLAETGVAGAGLVALALAWGVGRATRRYRKGGPADRVWIGTWGATCAAIGVTSLVDSTLSVIPTTAMVAAFTAAVAAHESLDAPPLRSPKRLLMLPIVALLAGLPPLLAPLAQASALDAQAHRLVRAGRYVDAVDAFRRAAAADPLSGEALPYFGDLLADLYLRKIDSSVGEWRTARARAAELYARAGRLSPWDGYPRAALGRLRRAEGRYPEARAALLAAIALDPYSPRYRLWLGETLAAAGDPRGAVEPLREAARLYPIELLVIERHEGRSAAYAQDQADLGEARRLLTRLGEAAP
ncbi:MAG TPA: O-antigen ligase family protein [bacterium]|nr:O-antigen ligase family protein [bacterium]